MSYIICFFSPLVFFLLFNSSLVLLSKKEFGKCIPLSFILCSMIMFSSQALFSTFNVGFFILLFLAFISIPILFIVKLRKPEIFSNFKQNYFDKGFIAFIIIYILFTILDFNRFFYAWDEFSHWGVMIKEMVRTDHFYSSLESTLMVHKDYPPMMQLLELFWTKLCGSYSEANLIKCLHIFEFSLFIPAITYFCKNNKTKISSILSTISVVVIAFLSILFFDMHSVINAIYIDYILAILTAYCLFIIITEKNKFSYFYLFNLGITSTFLVLLKQMGLPFYFIILFAFILDFIFNFIKNKPQCKKTKLVFIVISIIVLLVTLPLIEWKCWNDYVGELNVDKQFSLSDIHIFELPSILQGKSGEDYQTISGTNFLHALISDNITSSKIELSFVQACLIIFILYGLFLFIYKKDFSLGHKIIIILSLILGCFGYMFVMLVMYVFCFGAGEGPMLTSYDRYMDTYLILMVSLLIMLLFFKLKQNKKWIVISSIIIVLLLAQSPDRFADLLPKISKNTNVEYELDAEYLKDMVPENSMVYILSSEDNLVRQFLIKYYANPITTNVFYYQFDVSENASPYQYINNIKHYILGFDYLYLKETDDNFISKYSFLFKDGIIIENSLYKINKTNGSIEFELINNN